MKIMNRLTLRYLKENKKRTILTILCIALSVVMICCVGIAFYSGKQFYKEYIEESIGDYHYAIIDNSLQTIDLIKNDEQVNEYYFSNTVGYSYQEDENIKEQLTLKRGDSLYFEKYDIKDNLIRGRMPENPQEIVLSENYLKNNKLNKNIGDSVTFYSKDIETHKVTSYIFSIVGIMNEHLKQSMNSISFNAVSYIDYNSHDYYTLYVQDKEISTNIFIHGEYLQDKVERIQYNGSYLGIQDIFEENSKSTFLTIYALIGVLLSIIIFISVFIIYQAFNLSTGDRIQYLGMLSSVGATPKQKKRSVYYEGLLLSVVSIPLGIIMSFVGLSITFFFINQLNSIKDMGISISTSLSIEYLLMVIGISLLTIAISLYLPARKISKISVIDALKKNDEIKVNPKKLKKSLISKKIFNINQQLAIKNYKRQGRRSKTIIFSLVLSMAAFIGIFSFGMNMNKTSQKAQRYQKHDIQLNISGEPNQMNDLKQLLDTNDKVDSYYYLSEFHVKAKIDKSYFKSPDINECMFKDQDYLELMLIGVSEELYKKLCDDNNIDYRKNQAIIVNQMIEVAENKTSKIYQKMDSNFLKEIKYREVSDAGKIYENDLAKFNSIEMIEEDQYSLVQQPNLLSLITPIDYVLTAEKPVSDWVQYYINSSKHGELTKELNNNNYSAADYAATVEQNRQMFTIIQTFIYGFVLIMIIFTILNIINMMSASIDKRKKEFAMMLSVGMSPKGLQKMILNESLIYGLKTLLYGIPLSILVEFWIFLQTVGPNNTDIKFEISYIAYFIAFIVIMIVMILTFRVGLRQLKKQNIIETLKDDM